MMPWLIRELKRDTKLVAILIGMLIILSVAYCFLTLKSFSAVFAMCASWFTFILMKSSRNYVEMIFAQKMKETPYKDLLKAHGCTPGNAFQAGYWAGYSAAVGGAVLPSGSKVDGLADAMVCCQALKPNVPEGQRRTARNSVDAWDAGFSAGWTSAGGKGN